MANISVNLYDGELDISYDCSGAMKCKYALWEELPIENDEHCVHRYCGSCRSGTAKIEAIERLKRRLTQHAKELEN
jgi:hypothetical protein